MSKHSSKHRVLTGLAAVGLVLWAAAPSPAALVSQCTLTVASQTADDWRMTFVAQLDDEGSAGYVAGEDVVLMTPPGRGVALVSNPAAAPGWTWVDARPPAETANWWGGSSAGPDQTLRLRRYGYAPEDPPTPVTISCDVSGANERTYTLYNDTVGTYVVLRAGTTYTVEVPTGDVTFRLAAYPPPALEAGQSVTGVWKGDAQWADFDGDGDADLAICGVTSSGTHVTQTYENQSGTLVLRQNLDGVESESSGNLAWGDYDNDGDVDLVVAGWTGTERLTRVYRNDGNGNLTWDTQQVLTGVSYPSVAWGDYDGDGDLDLLITGHDGTLALCRIYRNDPPGVLLPDLSQSLTGLYAGSADWGDWDGDGDLDLIMTGSDGTVRRTILYRNEPTGTLTSDGAHGLPSVSLSDTAWGDFDNDGDVDLAFTGEESASGRYARVYANDGSGVFTLVGANLTTIYRSSCAWGDYDNDGDLDVAFCGYTGGGLLTTLYRNDGTSFTEAAWFSGVREGSLSWVDVDGDGDLDLFVTGADWSTQYAHVYREVSVPPNHAPAAPTGLQSGSGGGWCGLRLAWSGATDVETPSAGLYYSLQVGTAPGSGDVVSGTYGSPLLGNVGQATQVLLNVPPGTYYFRVRTVDAGLAASEWSATAWCHFYLGDSNGDDTVNRDDFVPFAGCLTGPASAWTDPACRCFDFDADGDVDLGDYATFQRSFSGGQ
ncbi:MAG TPA: FG-GAP-like repeat-containing protein [Phycisphaerae bacterium]|nr:FG-GAP-like repeat-containing protein [Phycisphaerae bacterium]HNU45656.1 FG-GAP-like repeat-containing protein [Phycisphaerae bacterium]